MLVQDMLVLFHASHHHEDCELQFRRSTQEPDVAMTGCVLAAVPLAALRTIVESEMVVSVPALTNTQPLEDSDPSAHSSLSDIVSVPPAW